MARGGNNSSQIDNVIMVPHKLPDGLPASVSNSATTQLYGETLCLERLENRNRIKGDMIAIKPNYRYYAKVIGAGDTTLASEATPMRNTEIPLRGTPENPVILYSRTKNNTPMGRPSDEDNTVTNIDDDEYDDGGGGGGGVVTPIDYGDGRSIGSRLGKQSSSSKISKQKIVLEGREENVDNIRPSPQIVTPSFSQIGGDFKSVSSTSSTIVTRKRSTGIGGGATSTKRKRSLRADDSLVEIRKQRVDQLYRQYQPYLLMGMMVVQLTLGWVGLDMATYVDEQKVMLVEYYALLREICEESVPSVEEMRKSNVGGKNTTTSPWNRLMFAIIGNTVVSCLDVSWD
ncbi:37.6 kDa [Spodoptera frugiperda ascovirus 1a]|uniref:37.6 kDa n=1 Tax=Spodoptera frugiperda ascovirus 1a TaxID=113370 RepID=Q0E545_SFAVA|nr:37.6 kDa [Spodoptera frugiperda ascovirus 1a]CAL44656.1 37.6 kDa [Spodoptera frugiperda ascovirus 1a]